MSQGLPASSVGSLEKNKFKNKIATLQQIEQDGELFESLEHISKFYNRNDSETRRELLGSIEKQTLQTHKIFLQSFEFVNQQLNQVNESIVEMRRNCNEMKENLEKTKNSSAKVIKEAEKLQKNREINREKKKMIEIFTEKFQLSEKERKLLTNYEMEASQDKLTIEFFEALQRVNEIISNTKKYLTLQKYANTEISIKDSLSLTQQAAFDRLFRWLQSQFKELQHSSPEITIEFHLAIRYLAERPVLLQHCIDGITESRSKSVFQVFLCALQKGGPNGVPKPIEIHAHDPCRYIGDMLGCLHQLVASEFELLQILFHFENQNKQGPEKSEKMHKKFELPPFKYEISQILSKIFEKIVQPFEIRFEQVLLSQPGPVIVFRLVNLLDFYHRTILKFLPADSFFLLSLLKLKQVALQDFHKLLSQTSEEIRQKPPSPPLDLSPPPIVHQTINRLLEIMSVFDSSLVPTEQRQAEFSPILQAILSPLLETCTIAATYLNGESDVALFLINCLGLIEVYPPPSSLLLIFPFLAFTYIPFPLPLSPFSLPQSSLTSFQFAQIKAEELQGQIEAHMNTLVQEEAKDLLQKSKLGGKLEIFHNWAHEDKKTRQPLSYVSLMDPRQLADAMRSFEEALLDISTMVSPPLPFSTPFVSFTHPLLSFLCLSTI